MKIPVTLTLTTEQHSALHRHLFPGDAKEAVAFLACNRRSGDRRHRLVVREIFPVPHHHCHFRTPTSVSWPTESIQLLLESAEECGYSLVKVHSHPTGIAGFSKTDDTADNALLPAISNWIDSQVLHGSALMFNNGQMRGRYIDDMGAFSDFHSISVIGDSLQFWYADQGDGVIPDFVASHGQIFGKGTHQQLKRLAIAVIGCSGTGGPLIEQLIRLGVGTLVLVDSDRIEFRNLNRIPFSSTNDAATARLKVDLFSEMADRIGLGTQIVAHPNNLWDREVVASVAQCDVVFGCMDSIDGRYLLNRLATYYLLPYIDIGVCLDTYRSGDLQGQIREACGTVHYLQPGLSSLVSRGLFSMEDVSAAGLQRVDPEAHKRQLKEKYIRGVDEAQPAVVSLNSFAASLAAMELLARIHPYRVEPNSEYASTEFSFASAEMFTENEGELCPLLDGLAGLGDQPVMLDLSALT